MFKIVLAGSVTSTYTTLRKLLEHQMNVVGVFGYEPANCGLVSGYVNLANICLEHKIPYFPFTQIGSDETFNQLQEISPDLFFVVGLSQIVPESMLQIAKMGNVGFHPTLLPRGRGRAPIAWLILEEAQGAANFFLIGSGVDDGPIFVQEPFFVEPSDNAASIEAKIIEATKQALDKWLPELKSGIWNPIPQNELEATYFGKRTPSDGWIDWNLSANRINKHIRASAFPHPGAYTFIADRKILIQSCKIENTLHYRGVVGRILLRRQGDYLIQTGEGLLWLTEVLDDMGSKVELRVGQRLGYYSEVEIFKLRKELKELKEKLGL